MVLNYLVFTDCKDTASFDTGIMKKFLIKIIRELETTGSCNLGRLDHRSLIN